MKNIIAFLAIAMLFSSCNNFMSGEKDFLNSMLDEPQNEFNSYSEAGSWIVENVTYRDREGDEWQSPRQTEVLKTGLCVDFCVLAAYYADELGHDVILRGVRDISKEYPHMIIVLDGVEFEPQTNEPSTYKYNYIKEEFTLAQALAKCILRDGNRSVADTVYK